MKKGISQEGLKLLACLTMLCDHVGHALVVHTGNAELYYLTRIIGRIAFPIYAFLLAEGFFHTRNRLRYFLRLAVGALLAEVPYDFLVSGAFSWSSQSVMVTLMLGFLAMMLMEKCTNPYAKFAAALPFAVLAELCRCDYGWQGVALIMLFHMSRDYYARNFIRLGGMLMLFHTMSGLAISLGQIAVPMQALGAFSMLFIAAYDGRKVTRSKAAQWVFYLFYPVHMAVLAVLEWLLYGR